MEVRLPGAILEWSSLEDEYSGLRGLQLRGVRQRGGEQVRVHGHTQCTPASTQKFKELVGSLFDSMVQEVGLDDDKLAELLEKGFESKQKKIFNQLLLADDFLRFKSLMLNRNKALEAEALKALQKSQAPEPRKQKSREEDVLQESQRAEEQRRRL